MLFSAKTFRLALAVTVVAAGVLTSPAFASAKPKHHAAKHTSSAAQRAKTAALNKNPSSRVLIHSVPTKPTTPATPFSFPAERARIAALNKNPSSRVLIHSAPVKAGNTGIVGSGVPQTLTGGAGKPTPIAFQNGNLGIAGTGIPQAGLNAAPAPATPPLGRVVSTPPVQPHASGQ